MSSKKAQQDAAEHKPDTSFEFGANVTEVPAVVKPAEKPAADNTFSRESLRLLQNYPAALGLQKHCHAVPVDKPSQETWFRVHPDHNEAGEEMYFDSYLLHIKNGPDRSIYQVAPALFPVLATERLLKPTRLVLVIDRQNELRLWPLRLHGEDGREDDWMSSALAVAEQAKTQWVRLVAGANGYQSITTTASIPDPIWPTMPLDELLDIAFAKRRIRTVEDPVLRRLRTGV